VLILSPWWIICHFSSSLRSPTPGFILQAGLLDSPEKSFFLHVYADAMAHASLRSGPTCAPRPGHGVDPRVLNYLDIDVTIVGARILIFFALDFKLVPKSEV
jgi:hypothetical protein